MKIKRKYFNGILISKHKSYPKIHWEWIVEPSQIQFYLPAWYFAHAFIRIGKRVYVLKGFDNDRS